MKVTEIAFTCYPVTNIRRARAFYEDLLKLEPTRTFGSGDVMWVEYDIGPATFAISNMSGDEWKPSSDGPSVAFEIDNFDEAIERLKENGVKFTLDAFETPVCRMAVITDPDGNSLTIHKRHAS